MEYKPLHKRETIGALGERGIQILVALDRPFTDADAEAAYKFADQLQDALERETLRLDPQAAKDRAAERENLLALFGDRKIYVQEIPNGYCHSACCSQRPWYTVTTSKGRITLGWRKRVINILWDNPEVAGDGDIVFPDENVTKDRNYIHAYGYDKAKQYIDRLLAWGGANANT